MLGLFMVAGLLVVSGPPAPKGVFGQVIAGNVAPDMERRRFPRLGISIDTPKGWHDIDKSELPRDLNIALFAGPGNFDKVILTTANSPRFQDADALAIFVDAGRNRGSALGFAEQIESALQAGIPDAMVTERARRLTVNGFNGAYVGLRMRMRGLVGIQVLNARFYLLELGDRDLIVSAGAVPGPDKREMVDRIVKTIRPLGRDE